MVDHRGYFLAGVDQFLLQLQQLVLGLHVEGNVIELDPARRFQPRGFVEVLGALPFEECDGRVGSGLEEIMPRPKAVGVVPDRPHQGESHHVPIEADGLFHVVGNHRQVIDSACLHLASRRSSRRVIQYIIRGCGGRNIGPKKYLPAIIGCLRKYCFRNNTGRKLYCQLYPRSL